MSARKKEPAEFVNEYLQLRGQDIAELHPAFSNVNELRSQYEAMDKYREFMDALHEYGELEGERLGFNPTSCSWSDMLKQLKIAQAAAAKSERAERGFFTRSRKKVTNVSRLLGVALAALPPELSSLQGGLSMVFDLTQRRESLRREILDVFEDIPAILVSACNKYKHFPKEKRLHDAIDDLKVTLFDTIPSLVEVIAPKTFSDKVANHFRGRKADDLLEAIRKSAKRVEACAGILRDDMAVETYLDTEEIDKTTKHIRVHVEQIHDLTSNVGQGVRSLNEHYEEFDSRMADLTQRQNCIIEQLNYALTSQHSLFRMLTDSVSTILFDQESSPQSPKHASTPGQLAALLQALGVRHGTDSHDLAVVLRQSEEFDSASKSVGAIILASIQFQNWLAGTGSDLIYIESHLDSSRFGKTSPISYFCGNMVQLFRRRDAGTTITLHFFCGEHVASNDELAGPRGLIRSILAQLLHSWPSAHLDAVNLGGFDGNREALSTVTLCEIFALVVRKLPQHMTLFCIVDDLAGFEKQKWDHDYWALLKMFAAIIFEGGPGMRFKLLMTSPTKSRRLQNQVSPAQLIEALVSKVSRVMEFGRR